MLSGSGAVKSIGHNGISGNVIVKANHIGNTNASFAVDMLIQNKKQ